MAQRVPTNLRNPQILAYRIKLTIPEISTTKRSALLRAEHEIIQVERSWSDVRKDLHSFDTQRHRADAGTGLGFVEMASHEPPENLITAGAAHVVRDFDSISPLELECILLRRDWIPRQAAVAGSG
jgi:hypothetical protein